MALTEISQPVIDGVNHLVTFIIDELGNFAHAIASSVMYDIHQLAGDPLALTADHLGNMWITVKDQAMTAWNTLVGDFETKIAGLVDMLKNINWVDVAAAIIGLSMPTLTTLARAVAQMLVAGVIVAI